MAQADSSRFQLRYSVETNWGETPATPTMTVARITGESLVLTKKIAKSVEIRSDRNMPDVIQTGQAAGGGVNFELSWSNFDTFFAALLASSWTALTITGLTITVASGAKTATRSAGSFITDGVVIGQYVKFTGMTNAANNAIFRVLSLTATVLTLEDPDGALVNETSGAAAAGYKSNYIRNGVVAKSLLLESQFADINQFIYMNGMRLGQMALTFNAGATVTGQMTFMGKQAVASGATVSGSIVQAATTDVLACGKNVGFIRKNSLPLATGIKDITLTINGTLRELLTVASLYPINVGFGQFMINGKFTVYFEDLTLYNHFLNHDTVELTWRTTDAAGNAIIFTIDALKFIKGEPTASAINTDATVPLEFEAKYNSTYGNMIQVDSISA